jgi:hypothetical protein
MELLEEQVISQFKKFHFQELGWLVYFPSCDNEGKYNNYTVVLKKGISHPEKTVRLGEILEDPEFELHYPHTVGYYKLSAGEGTSFKPDYLELRKIGTVEEFWMFLNSLNI